MTVTVTEPRTPEQTTVDPDCLTRVKTGIRLLEERYGPHWVDRVNPDTLDLTSGRHCILGQVYGDFSNGMDTLWGKNSCGNDPIPGYGTITDCGFYQPADPWASHHDRYTKLHNAWRHALTPHIHKENA